MCEHVELAYATTIHRAQGDTVAAAQLLIGAATGAAAAYADVLWRALRGLGLFGGRFSLCCGGRRRFAARRWTTLMLSAYYARMNRRELLSLLRLTRP